MITTPTDPRWLGVALGDLDCVLIDHAHCEKKAAASAMSLVAAFPECARLVRRLSGLAIEELRHFRLVYGLLEARGIGLGPDPGDPYAKALQGEVRAPRNQRLLDRLLVSGLIEARSHERLALLAEGLPDPELAGFYRSLAKAESGHAELFAELAAHYAGAEVARERADELAVEEARIVAALSIEPRIH